MAMPSVTTASPVAVAASSSDHGCEDDNIINIQIFVPDLQVQKCLNVFLDEIVWDLKNKLLAALPQQLPQAFNYGLFLPPCDGRAGKFLLEDRPIRDYPFHDCVPYLELKYKKRVYKMFKLDEKQLKQLHSKNNLKKFVEYVQVRNSDKVEKFCRQGLDANFLDNDGETPLTIASGVSDNRKVIIQLVGGGAHLDFRNSEGQTGMHKAAFLSMTENVKTLLELGASPNYRDQIGLTSLYYNMLMTDSNDSVAEMLLAEAAEIGITDMHGNQEIHQACKNGLMKHVEHLLYYGANINAQNINGNTALHVCAVNNRPDCARVLLFRGADPQLPNKQGQTALHVAHIVGNAGVAEVIQNHNPSSTVPYRGTPKYNTNRRRNNTITRRRSLSQSSLVSSQSDYYRTPQPVRSQNFVAPSPSPSRATVIGNGSEYSTMRRYSVDAVQPAASGSDLNIPRILVIPRGPGTKGFGFILRGAKRAESDMNFQPTPMVPALQFFEGVDMSGMAMRAGLRPGDFLLEINGCDVRKASHEQVVQLIKQADDTITLKVITIDLHTGNPLTSQSHYAGTMPSRRNNSVPRHVGLPPVPPQRHPATSLTYTDGGTIQNMMFSYSDAQQTYYQSSTAAAIANRTSSSVLLHHNPVKSIESLVSCGNGDLYGTAGVDYAAWPQHAHDPSSSSTATHFRCASVKSRPSAQRRISAAELEHLMVRQRAATTSSLGTSSSQFQPQTLLYAQEPMSSQTPRKFTSVADMKRKKNRGMLSPSLHSGLHRNPYEQDPYQQPLSLGREQNNMLKSFNSSPDLQSRSAFESNSNDSVPTPPPMLDFTRRQSSNDVRVAYSEYSRPFRPALRPKTPPPPPPENKEIYESRAAGRLSSVPPPQPDPDYSDSTDQEQDTPRSPPVVKKQNAPRPEPALPPAAPIAAPSTASKPPPPPPPPPPPFSDLQKATSTARKANITVPNGDCRGISAEALTSVTLKPATTETKKPAQNAANGTSRLGKGNMDFHDDLRNALAKRRSKVSVDDDEPIRQNSEVETTPGVTVLNKCGGLSLRESVRENVQTSSKTAPKLQHSPPGFGNKKDSGYTSSRTSLEPSECGDEPLGVTLVRVHDLSGKSTPTANDYRVSILSQQLEDNYGTTSLLQQRKEQQDTMLVSSPGSSDFSTIADRPLLIENPLRTPDADYDDPNSGTADTDHESCLKTYTNDGQFSGKDLARWDVADVADWLRSLNLSTQYETKFLFQRISGPDLLQFDRARYTQLGVTRIAHRQAMEASLKSFSSSA